MNEIIPSQIRGSKVYIAGPFFNAQQLSIIMGIEKILDEFSIRYHSPRKSGTLMSEKFDSAEAKELRIQEIYDENISMLKNCQSMICVIDDRDVGTMFEFGYFTSLLHENEQKKIITFTNKTYGVNVMLRNSCHAHTKGLDDLRKLFRNIADNNMIFSYMSAKEHQNFSDDVT